MLISKTDRRGSAMDVILWVIIGFITVVFLGGWLYLNSEVTTAFQSVDNEIVSSAVNATFVPAQQALDNYLPIISFIIIMGMLISIFISNYFVRGNPVFFVVHLIFTVAAIAVSATISNRYMELLNHETIGATLQTFTASNYVMQWLPYFTAVVGIVGAIFLFINLVRDKDQGASI